MNGRGFAYRAWRLYAAPATLFLYCFGVERETREAFFREVWQARHEGK